MYVSMSPREIEGKPLAKGPEVGPRRREEHAVDGVETPSARDAAIEVTLGHGGHKVNLRIGSENSVFVRFGLKLHEISLGFQYKIFA